MLRYTEELGVQVTGCHPFNLQAKLEDKSKKLTLTALAGLPLRSLAASQHIFQDKILLPLFPSICISRKVICNDL